MVSIEDRLEEMRLQLEDMEGAENRIDFSEFGAALATAVGSSIASYESIFHERYPDEDVRETARRWWGANVEKQRCAGLVKEAGPTTALDEIIVEEPGRGEEHEV